jgi:hypothetical protein
MEALLAWLQATSIAAAVRDSTPLTGTLSAVHLLGFTLVTGGAFVSNLRLLGIVLPERSVLDVSRPASRGIAVGLLVSIATGALLFAPRATVASANPIFQIKMLLLASAAAFHFAVHRTVARRPIATPVMLRAVGGVGFLLWAGLALAGCAFILLE